MDRTSTVKRYTNETKIDLTFGVDGEGKASLETGVPFLSHMLDLFAKHGQFDLSVDAKGDIEVDGHHTTEDIGICIGQALREALGDKKGIKRYGNAFVPMDEALAQCAVDVGGRGFASIETSFDQHWIGDMSASLINHFIHSFATEARITIHAKIIAGHNDHHRAEALFKALARALDDATRIDVRRGDSVPSTKGTISS